jgi:hypothetical protein
MEALVRIPGCSEVVWDLFRALPTHLPEMALFYSSPITTRATLAAVTSMTKWLQARRHALVPQLAGLPIPAPVGEGLSANSPPNLWCDTIEYMLELADFSHQNLVRAAALLDPGSCTAAAATAAPAGRRSRAWRVEKTLLDRQSASTAQGGAVIQALATYKTQVLGNPQLLETILEKLQQGLAAQQHAAAVRQAASLAKQRGGDVVALTDQLQGIQVGSSTTSISSGGGKMGADDATASTLPQRTQMTDTTNSTSTASSAAGGALPVTPGDITVAANALLVACKAAGALCGVPQLLEYLSSALAMGRRLPGYPAPSPDEFSSKRTQLLANIQEVAEWGVLLHPLLVQLLPAEQGQVLVDLRSRLGDGGGNSSGGAAQQEGRRSSNNRLSAEEAAAVLAALQHVVIPGQPGCSNPRCCCLEGPSEAAVKTQVCAACRGVRYCSAACQKAHWRAGHKEACKAAQAAAKEAAAAGGKVA